MFNYWLSVTGISGVISGGVGSGISLGSDVGMGIGVGSSKMSGVGIVISSTTGVDSDAWSGVDLTEAGSGVGVSVC